MLEQLNSPQMYLICGVIVLTVAVFCAIFMIRAYRTGIKIGMDKDKLKTTITASASFAVLPSIGILLGVIALSGSLGTPLPWLRLSVIGALHYETQVAEVAAEYAGLPALSASYMTPEAFTTIAFTMGFCICFGMICSLLFTKKYTKKINSAPAAEEKKEDTPKKKKGLAGFGDIAMTAMFIGLLSCYIGSYISTGITEGTWIRLAVAAVGALAMGFFTYLKEKKNQEWVDSFSIAGSMLIAMIAAVGFAQIL